MPIPERSKGREKTLPAAQPQNSIALDFTAPIKEALASDLWSSAIGLISR